LQLTETRVERSSPLRKEISQLATELVECYRPSEDFDKEFQLYESQQKYYSDNDDARGVIPWEVLKGLCCEHYGQREEALHHLEKSFKVWQEIEEHYVSGL
jgi:hypothetical protein